MIDSQTNSSVNILIKIFTRWMLQKDQNVLTVQCIWPGIMLLSRVTRPFYKREAHTTAIKRYYKVKQMQSSFVLQSTAYCWIFLKRFLCLFLVALFFLPSLFCGREWQKTCYCTNVRRMLLLFSVNESCCDKLSLSLLSNLSLLSLSLSLFLTTD